MLILQGLKCCYLKQVREGGHSRDPPMVWLNGKPVELVSQEIDNLYMFWKSDRSGTELVEPS
jgi:hypothetical protein